MKFFLLALCVVAAVAVPIPEDDDGGAVEFIVNGVVEGEPLELGDVLGIHVNEHVDGVLASSTNLLHPLTAVGIAEAAAAAAAEAAAAEAAAAEAAAAEAAADAPLIPAPVVLPPPSLPEVVIPQPVVLPVPTLPIVPKPIELPAPDAPEVIIPEPIMVPVPPKPEVVAIVPEPVVLPPPSLPEVVAEPVDVPVAAAQGPNGEVFNNGVVQVQVNTPQEAGMFSTLQSWMNLVLNYFTEDGQTTHQII